MLPICSFLGRPSKISIPFNSPSPASTAPASLPPSCSRQDSSNSLINLGLSPALFPNKHKLFPVAFPLLLQKGERVLTRQEAEGAGEEHPAGEVHGNAGCPAAWPQASVGGSQPDW